jgi:glycosyltransferase involved in cell wall biosynthesis
MRVKSVVHVAAMYPPALGGMEQVVQSLAREQYRLGTPVTVLTSDQRANGGPRVNEPFPVLRMRSIYVAHTPVIPGLLTRLLGLGPGAIVHLHINTAYTPEIVWIYARLTGSRYLAHVHLDVLPSGRAGLLLAPYKQVVLRRVLRSATAVLVPTSDYKEIISDKYGIPPQRVVVIRNGTGHEIAEQAKALPAGEGRRRLLYVGRLSVQKNIPLMLEAIAAYVRRYGDDVILSIVGEGELRPAVEAQIDRLGIAGNVILHGAMGGKPLESIYEDSDLFLLTSTGESFGIVLVEAMTKGLPIVSVDIPAVRNVVADGVNGLLAEPSPQRVADAIRRLLGDKELYSVVSRNNLTKSRGYGWKEIAEELTTIYESI